MKITLGKQLGGGFAVILFLMMISSALSYRKSLEIKEINESFILPSLQAVNQLKDDLDYSAGKARQTILAATEPVRKEQARKKFDGAWDRMDKTVAKIDGLSPRWTVQQNKETLTQIKQALPKIHDAQQATIETASSGSFNAVIHAGNDYADEVTPVVDETIKMSGEISDNFEKRLTAQREGLNSANDSMVWTMGVATLVALGIGIFLASFLSRKISLGTAAVLRLAESVT